MVQWTDCIIPCLICNSWLEWIWEVLIIFVIWNDLKIIIQESRIGLPSVYESCTDTKSDCWIKINNTGDVCLVTRWLRFNDWTNNKIIFRGNKQITTCGIISFNSSNISTISNFFSLKEVWCDDFWIKYWEECFGCHWTRNGTCNLTRELTWRKIISQIVFNIRICTTKLTIKCGYLKQRIIIIFRVVTSTSGIEPDCNVLNNYLLTNLKWPIFCLTKLFREGKSDNFVGRVIRYGTYTETICILSGNKCWWNIIQWFGVFDNIDFIVTKFPFQVLNMKLINSRG